MKLIVRSQFNAPTGISFMARSFLDSLGPEIDLKIENIQHSPMNVPVNQFQTERYTSLANKQSDAPIAIEIANMDKCTKFDNKYHILWTNAPSSRIPDTILTRLHAIDEIWVGTEFSQAILERAGIKNVHVMSMPIDVETYTQSNAEIPIVDINYTMHGKFIPREQRPPVIGMIGKWDKRKNIDDFLTLMFSQYNKGDCSIILKTYSEKMDRSEDFNIMKIIKEYRDKFPNGPNVTLVTHMLSDVNMAMLMNSIDVYCSLSRYEVHGTDILCAMASNVPVIVSLSSGTPELVKDTTMLCGSVLEPVSDYGPAMSHNWWGRPDLYSVTQKINTVLNGNNSKIDELKVKALELIRTRNNSKIVKEKVLERLNSISKSMPALELKS